jgi:hypothetical protein
MFIGKLFITGAVALLVLVISATVASPGESVRTAVRRAINDDDAGSQPTAPSGGMLIAFTFE